MTNLVKMIKLELESMNVSDSFPLIVSVKEEVSKNKNEVKHQNCVELQENDSVLNGVEEEYRLKTICSLHMNPLIFKNEIEDFLNFFFEVYSDAFVHKTLKHFNGSDYVSFSLFCDKDNHVKEFTLIWDEIINLFQEAVKSNEYVKIKSNKNHTITKEILVEISFPSKWCVDYTSKENEV